MEAHVALRVNDETPGQRLARDVRPLLIELQNEIAVHLASP